MAKPRSACHGWDMCRPYSSTLQPRCTPSRTGTGVKLRWNPRSLAEMAPPLAKFTNLFAAKLILISKNCPPLRKSELEYYAML